jgi:hypothetical protein
VRWTAAEVNPATLSWYQNGVSYLHKLSFNGIPQILTFTPEAQTFFNNWHDAHMEEAESPSLSLYLQGTFGKLKGYCARLALIHALCSEGTSSTVGLDSVTAAAAMVDYFKDQARKVDSLLDRGKQNPVERMKVAIRRRLSVCRYIGRRDLQRKMNGKGEDFNQALIEMSQPEVVITKDSNNTEYVGPFLLPTDNRHTDREGQ